MHADASSPLSLIVDRLLLCRAYGKATREYNNIDHRIDILSHGQDYNTHVVMAEEIADAHHSSSKE